MKKTTCLEAPVAKVGLKRRPVELDAQQVSYRRSASLSHPVRESLP